MKSNSNLAKENNVLLLGKQCYCITVQTLLMVTCLSFQELYRVRILILCVPVCGLHKVLKLIIQLQKDVLNKLEKTKHLQTSTLCLTRSKIYQYARRLVNQKLRQGQHERKNGQQFSILFHFLDVQQLYGYTFHSKILISIYLYRIKNTSLTTIIKIM